MNVVAATTATSLNFKTNSLYHRVFNISTKQVDDIYNRGGKVQTDSNFTRAPL